PVRPSTPAKLRGSSHLSRSLAARTETSGGSRSRLRWLQIHPVDDADPQQRLAGYERVEDIGRRITPFRSPEEQSDGDDGGQREDLLQGELKRTLPHAL